MPLFGGHKKEDKKHNTLRRERDQDLLDNNNQTTAGVGGVGTGAAGGMNSSSMAGSGVTTADDSRMSSSGGRAMYDQQQSNQPMANDYAGTAQPGMAGGNLGYIDPSMMAGNQSNIPPSSHLNASQGGVGHASTGKVEKALGSIVGSNALKAKGMQKEMEANALKTQSSELAEAERLEREALLRRERAVAHGAHPDNRHLGGQQINN